MSKHRRNSLETVIDGDSGGADQPSCYAKHSDLLTNLQNLTYTVEEGLARMGLTHNESKVYVFLAKTGARKASEIAKVLNLPRTETYNILGSLQKKGLVTCTMHYPVAFVAVPFEGALNTLLGMGKEKLVTLEEQGRVLLGTWSSIADHEVTYNEINDEQFQILEGNNSIYGKIKDVVSSAQKEVIVLGNAKQLAKLSHHEITDNLQLLATKGVDVKILGSFEPSFEVLNEIKKCKLKILGNPTNNIHCVAVDKTKLVFFIKDDKTELSAIWTDCGSLVHSMLCLFEELWKDC